MYIKKSYIQEHFQCKYRLNTLNSKAFVSQFLLRIKQEIQFKYFHLIQSLR